MANYLDSISNHFFTVTIFFEDGTTIVEQMFCKSSEINLEVKEKYGENVKYEYERAFEPNHSKLDKIIF